MPTSKTSSPVYAICEEKMPIVEQAMLVANPELAPASQFLAEHPHVWESGNPTTSDYDGSFVRQVKPLPNAAYFFTAESGLPIADTVAGYYEQAAIAQPQMFALYADRDRATKHYFNRIQQSELPTYEFASEVDRLRSIRSSQGLTDVCLVDQFTISGKTASYGLELLRAAGFASENTSVVLGRWYSESRMNIPVDYSGLLYTSALESGNPVREKLYAIGRLAAKQQAGVL